MNDTNHFEDPIWFERADLRCEGDLYITARYLPEGRAPDPCFHLDAKATGAIGPNEAGTLLIDLWATETTHDRIASMQIQFSPSTAAIDDGYVRGDYKGTGFPHLLVAIAQNLSGWTRGVTGFQHLLLD